MLTDVIYRLFGEQWSVDINVRDRDEDGDTKTLADERQEKLERRRQSLYDDIRNHPAVQAAEELFDAGEPRIEVKLHDE